MSSWTRVTSKKSPNVYESCPKMISLAKWKISTSLQKLPRNVGDLGNIIVATGFEKLPKVQSIAQSGHNVFGQLGWACILTPPIKPIWYIVPRKNYTNLSLYYGMRKTSREVLSRLRYLNLIFPITYIFGFNNDLMKSFESKLK